MVNNNEDGGWFDNILSILNKVEKKPYNIDILDLTKEDFTRIGVVVDMWNTIRHFSQPDPTGYDKTIDDISSKLQRSFFKTYNESLLNQS